MCHAFAHSTHVFQASTCMQCRPVFCRLCKCWCFFEQVCFTKMSINCAFLQLWTQKKMQNKACNQHFLVYFFFTLIGYLDQKLWWFKRTTSHFIKNHFYVFFQNAQHCNVRKNAVFKKIWGFVSEYVRTITYVLFIIKSWVLSWSSLRTPVFLKVDWCTLSAVM